MPNADRPDTPHLVVVRTLGMREEREAPVDAVVEYSHWHPGDRDWQYGFHTSIEAIVAEFSEDGWFLVQRLDFEKPYESELIFIARYGDFFGPNVVELREKFEKEFGVDLHMQSPESD
jgi:hypothetical protein